MNKSGNEVTLPYSTSLTNVYGTESIFLVSSFPIVRNDTLEPSGGRLITQWHQGSYYNLFTPFYKNSQSLHTPVGCIAVAIGQFLFHSHNFRKIPQGTITEGIYDSSKNEYNFSGFSTTIWDKFNTYPDYSNNAIYMKPTAAFLGYIGKSIGTVYAEYVGEGSGSDIRNSKCLNFFKSQSGLSVSIKTLSSNYVKSVITRGFPVIFQILHPNDAKGHCALIDQMVTETLRIS